MGCWPRVDVGCLRYCTKHKLLTRCGCLELLPGVDVVGISPNTSCWPGVDVWSCWPGVNALSCWPGVDVWSCWPGVNALSCWPGVDVWSSRPGVNALSCWPGVDVWSCWPDVDIGCFRYFTKHELLTGCWHWVFQVFHQTRAVDIGCFRYFTKHELLTGCWHWVFQVFHQTRAVDRVLTLGVSGISPNMSCWPGVDIGCFRYFTKHELLTLGVSGISPNMSCGSCSSWRSRGSPTHSGSWRRCMDFIDAVTGSWTTTSPSSTHWVGGGHSICCLSCLALFQFRWGEGGLLIDKFVSEEVVSWSGILWVWAVGGNCRPVKGHKQARTKCFSTCLLSS